MKDMIKLVPMELNVAELIGLILTSSVALIAIIIILCLFIDVIRTDRKDADRDHSRFPPAP